MQIPRILPKGNNWLLFKHAVTAFWLYIAALCRTTCQKRMKKITNNLVEQGLGLSQQTRDTEPMWI